MLRVGETEPACRQSPGHRRLAMFTNRRRFSSPSFLALHRDDHSNRF